MKNEFITTSSIFTIISIFCCRKVVEQNKIDFDSFSVEEIKDRRSHPAKFNLNLIKKSVI